ncbi:hypothetical protein ND6B_1211 [Pseudoalteromonas sp. ND6B]|jgi:hypothetical protein|nr:hypothetical protein ND6B_1211 [Pseudoalteromonas sp. ND6B]
MECLLKQGSKVAFLDYQSLVSPLLEYLANGKAVKLNEIDVEIYKNLAFLQKS